LITPCVEHKIARANCPYQQGCENNGAHQTLLGFISLCHFCYILLLPIYVSMSSRVAAKDLQLPQGGDLESLHWLPRTNVY
jgi:hypothetical protein